MQPLGENNYNLTDEQRTFLAVEKNNGCFDKDIQQRFSEKWPDRPIPKRSTIYRNAQKLLNNFTVMNQHKGNSGRKTKTLCQICS